jgi:ferredoxin
MAFVIAEPCIGTKDTACVDACPVDCIHPKKNTTYDDGRPTFDDVPQLYIDPVECIDCGAWVPVCPVSAIFALDDLPEKWKQYTELNESYVKAGKYTPKSSSSTRQIVLDLVGLRKRLIGSREGRSRKLLGQQVFISNVCLCRQELSGLIQLCRAASSIVSYTRFVQSLPASHNRDREPSSRPHRTSPRPPATDWVETGFYRSSQHVFRTITGSISHHIRAIAVGLNRKCQRKYTVDSPVVESAGLRGALANQIRN